MADVETAVQLLHSIQYAFQVINTLKPSAASYPPECTLNDGDSFDFIVVGAGSAGSVIASRLSENQNVSVLVLEAGGYPPIESEVPSWFTFLASSQYDYNFTSVNDGFSAQNLQGKVVELTQGKMVGGSSGLHHMMHTNGDPEDYNNWAKILNDPKWNYTNVLKYLKKKEKLLDAELLSSEFASLHGNDGPMKIKKETYPSNLKYMNALEEIGIKVVKDITSATSAIGVTESLFEIACEKRQSSALSYLGPAKSRTNLCLSVSTTVTKLLIENNTAKGVLATTSSGKSYKLNAKKEVIVSAGAINTPKLLMLSGIGPKDHLQELGIDLVANLPVGDNLQDHACAAMVFQVEACDGSSAVSNPHRFTPSFNAYVSLDSSKLYADYDTINLVFPCNSNDQLLLDVNMFKYSYNISQKFYDATKKRNTIYSLLGLVMPKSRGQIRLASADFNDNPLVRTGIFSNPEDVDLIAKSFMHYTQVLKTKYFSSVGASLVDTGLCKDYEPNSFEFWKCYAVEMSATMWHYSGTCAMGNVLDSNLRVKGVKNLRVIDASSMPTLIRGKVYAAVIMVAEYGADIVRAEWNI